MSTLPTVIYSPGKSLILRVSSLIHSFHLFSSYECRLNHSILFEGTTEKVFETKTELYDLYLDGNDIRVVSPQLKPVLRVTRGDKERLHQLYAALRFAASISTRYYFAINTLVQAVSGTTLM